MPSWRGLLSRLDEPDRFAFSANLIAHNSRDDLERCVESVRRHAGSRAVELVIVDNGSTDATLACLKQRAGEGAVGDVPVRVLFADHNLGFAAARNAAYVTSLGGVIVALDTSIELAGDIWEPIERALADPTAGLVGPFGLVTCDLTKFAESAGPGVGAAERYLVSFHRREHKHWLDHAQTHAHMHRPHPRWLARGVMAQYQPHGAAERGREQSEAEDGR